MNLTPISRKSLEILEDRLKGHHEFYKFGHCDGQQLEENIYHAIKDEYSIVRYEPGSHAISDILVSDTLFYDEHTMGHISIKAGKIKNEVIEITGHRLTAYVSAANTTLRAFENLTERLNSVKPDMLIACPFDDVHHCYRVLFIFKDVFQYPKEMGEWVQVRGKKGITGCKYTALNGMQCKITFSTSSQIVWTIPLRLCTVASVIHV